MFVTVQGISSATTVLTMQGVVGKTKGRLGGAPSVSGEVSGLETITVVTDSAVDLTGMEGGSAVVATVRVSDVRVVISTKAASVTVG